MTLSDTRRSRCPHGNVEVAPRRRRVSPDYPPHPPSVPCPLPRRTKRVHASIASPFTRPSPLFRRVGIRTFTFEACSDFTRVTARWIAQPSNAAFVTRLRPAQYPNEPLVSYQINRQLSGWNLPPLVTRAGGKERLTGPVVATVYPTGSPYR
jgi:hypothetical protein